MKIAIIGTGISGLSCAHKLHKQHDIYVYEKAPKIGGHTATMDIHYKGENHLIDTGFIVYNDWTYPNFIALLQELGVESQATDMSFSVSEMSKGVEYAGSNLDTLFAQRCNLVNPKFLLMLWDIFHFNKHAEKDLNSGYISEETTLGEYLQRRNYSTAMRDWYLIPMGSAIWSSTLQDMLDFPLLFFVRFFVNHGLLNIVNRPQWRVVKGGSSSYLKPLTNNFAERIKCNSKISSVERFENNVTINFVDGTHEAFDHLIFACHSDEALALLKDASLQEQEILSAIPYRNNSVVLHTDEALLPRSRKAWASWNYLLASKLTTRNSASPPILSYNMNILQNIKSDFTYIVTLNAQDKIDPSKIIGQYNYAHPLFNLIGIRAQARKKEIDGQRHTWYCGAYWRNGFHEDGCASGFEVADAINKLSA